MMTRKEEAAEFWMLTQGVLSDSKVEADEARVLKRWLEEHKKGDEFDRTIALLDKFLADGWVDRFESQDICTVIGNVLRTLRTAAEAEA